MIGKWGNWAKSTLQTRVPDISSSVERRVWRVQTQERGPPLALAEFDPFEAFDTFDTSVCFESFDNLGMLTFV